MAADRLIIYKQEFLPGQQGMVTIPVGKLPLGPQIGVKVYVYRSLHPGPVLLVLGGLHGDEINGVEIVRRMQVMRQFDAVIKGTVIAIPILNAYGFLYFSRETADGKDVNRSFPGSPKGSMASRVANAISRHILPSITHGIDLHTGGGQRYNFPQVRFTQFDQKSQELAKTFGAPLMLPQKPIGKSLRKAARDLGIPLIVYEGGEAMRFDEDTIQKGIEGIMNVMTTFQMIVAKETPNVSAVYTKTTWVRANDSGLVEYRIYSGSLVKKGDILCEINDPYGESKSTIVAPFEGFIIGHNNCPVVVHGDPLFHIGHNLVSEEEE